jgi:hypothetical protein
VPSFDKAVVFVAVVGPLGLIVLHCTAAKVIIGSLSFEGATVFFYGLSYFLIRFGVIAQETTDPSAFEEPRWRGTVWGILSLLLSFVFLNVLQRYLEGIFAASLP